MENFRRPYAAVSIQDFWRRWHISLTAWFTDYVYIPLGGRRRGVTRQCVNIMAVFLLSGLWHGADWTFVVWGGIHGLYQVCGVLSRLGTGWGIDAQRFAALRQHLPFVLSVLVCLYFLERLPREKPRGESGAKTMTVLALLLAIGLGWWIGLAGGGGNAFIYFQF